jgi:Putative beta-barrel porin 2
MSKFALAAIAASISFIASPALRAGEEMSKDVMSDNKGSDLDGGNFSHFPFHVSVSVRAGYDDNVNTTTFNEQESAFVNFGGTASYNFGSPRTALSLVVGGGLTYYLDDISGREDDYDSNFYVSFSITHKASSRLTLAATTYLTYQTQPDFSLNIGLNRQSGNFFYTSDKFSAAYLWTPRFSTVTSYTLGVVNYDEESIGNFEDRFENTFGNEFRFLIAPTTSLIAEYRYEFISYDDNDFRDSDTHFFLAGIDHSFGPRFNISVRGGLEAREYDQHGDETDPYFEGTLIYALGRRTSITFTNRYAIEEPDVAGSFSRTTYRTGLSVRYNFTSRLSANLAAFYEHDDNDGYSNFFVVTPEFQEDSFDLALSARYAITRSFALEAGYNFTDVGSDIRLREYTRNRFWAGLNFSF